MQLNKVEWNSFKKEEEKKKFSRKIENIEKSSIYPSLLQIIRYTRNMHLMYN